MYDLDAGNIYIDEVQKQCHAHIVSSNTNRLLTDFCSLPGPVVAEIYCDTLSFFFSASYNGVVF